MKPRLPDRFHDALSALAGASFVLLIIVLAFHNRLVVDDWDYLAHLGGTGVPGYVGHLYQSWSGRWAAYSLTGAVVALHAVPGSLAAFTLITFALVYAVLRSIVSALLARAGYRLPGRRLAWLGGVLCMSLFFTSYSTGETWFWLVHVCVYLWSILMSLLLVRLFLDGKAPAWQWLAIPWPALYIGGASESFASMNLFLGVLFLGLSQPGRFPGPRLNVPAAVRRKVLLSLVFLAAGFAVTMLAPGNDNRFGALPHVPWYQTAWIEIKSCIKVFFIRTPQALPALMLFSLPWLWLGRDLAAPGDHRSPRDFFGAVRRHGARFAVLVCIALLPTAVVMSELGPDRALAQVTFGIAFAFAALLFHAGLRLRLPDGVDRFRLPATALLAVWVTWTACSQYGITKRYAAAYDARWEYLRQLEAEGNTKAVALDPLPPAGMLSAGEITTDTGHFANRFLQNALHLQFPVRRKDE